MGRNRDEKFIKAFAENFKKLRKSKKLTQEDLSGLCDVQLSQIGRIERGEINVTISSIFLLAKALKVEPKVLLDFKHKT